MPEVSISLRAVIIALLLAALGMLVVISLLVKGHTVVPLDARAPRSGGYGEPKRGSTTAGLKAVKGADKPPSPGFANVALSQNQASSDEPNGDPSASTPRMHVKGRVVNESGGDPRVCCGSSEITLQGEGLSLTARVKWDDSGAIGDFDFGNLPGGKYVLCPLSGTGTTWNPERYVVESPFDGPVFGLRHSFTVLRARIVDGQTMEPLEGCALTFVRSNGTVLIEDDVFIYKCWPEGLEGQWAVGKWGYVPKAGMVEQLTGQVPHVVKLEPGWGRVLVVRDSAMNAVAGAVVYLDGAEHGQTSNDGMILVSAAEQPAVIAIQYKESWVEESLKGVRRGAEADYSILTIALR